MEENALVAVVRTPPGDHRDPPAITVPLANMFARVENALVAVRLVAGVVVVGMILRKVNQCLVVE